MDKYNSVAMRVVNVLLSSLLKGGSSNAVSLVVLDRQVDVCEVFKRVTDILREHSESIPLIVSESTNTLRFGGKPLRIISSLQLDKIRGIEFSELWYEESTSLSTEQLCFLKSVVRNERT